jgi:flagellar protein FliO/FliZ
MQALTFFFAFVVVLALIGVVAWLIRRFASNRLGANTQRGRMPRLAVIDAAAVDGRRRLVLVRRDNVEHLLMIGGPTDIVVEPNIVRGAPSRDQLPPRPAVASPDMQPRIAPLPDPAAWGENEAARAEPFDHAEPQMPEPPLRPTRPAFADEVRRPQRERPADPLAGFTAESIGGRPEPVAPPAPPRMPRGEPMPRSEPMMPRPARPMPVETPKAPPREARPAAPPPSPPPVPPMSPPMSSADQNLAEMAQRLEAALRRPGGDAVAPPVAPEPPPARPVPRSEQPPPAPSGPAPKTGFDNLEDEMASLLGRPKNSS